MGHSLKIDCSHTKDVITAITVYSQVTHSLSSLEIIMQVKI